MLWAILVKAKFLVQKCDLSSLENRLCDSRDSVCLVYKGTKDEINLLNSMPFTASQEG